MTLATVRAVSQAILRSEEHTSELQSRLHIVCRLLLEKKKEPLGDLEAVDVRQLDVEKNEVGTVLLRLCDAADAGFGFGHDDESMTLEQLFFFKAAATTEIYTLSLHDALPI